MLERYYKAGGFIQLLNLMETTGKDKREKFLTLIKAEDERWAQALEKKMLSIPKILSWDQQTLMEIVANLQEVTIAYAMHGFDPANQDKIRTCMGPQQKRKVDEIFKEKKPTTAEISTMWGKILTEVRKLITEGKLRIEKIDPELHIPDNYEEELKKGHVPAAAGSPEGAALNFESAEVMSVDPNNTVAVGELKRKAMKLTAENNQLTGEVKKLREKLESIRKLAG